MAESIVLLLSSNPAVVELVVSSVDPRFMVVASVASAQVVVDPRIILLEIVPGEAAVVNIEQLRERFPGVPIVTVGPETPAPLADDHIAGSQLDSDRIRRVIRSVVERRDLLDALVWRTALLADSERRFRALVVRSSDIIGLLESDGTYRYASPAVMERLGYDAETMRGRNFLAMVHPDDGPAAESFLAAVRRAPGAPLAHPFRVRRADGGWMEAEVVAANQLDDPLVEGIVINMRDLTQRHEQERELRGKDMELRLLLNQLPAIVWTTDLDLRMTFTRGRGLALIGSHANRAKGVTIFEMFGEADGSGAAVRAHLDALQGRSAEAKAFPWRGRLLDAYVEPLRDDNGDIKGTLGLTIDVTDQALSDARVRKSEEQYRSMIEMMSEGLVELDENHVAIFVNGRTCDLLGYRRDELVGRSADQLLPVSGDQESIVDKPDSRRRDVPAQYEVRSRNADGERIDLLVSSSPRLDDQGRYKGSIDLLTDITERRRAEDEIRQRERRLEFLVDRVPAALWTIDRNLIITSSRGAGLERLGFDPGELTGSSLASYFGNTDPEFPELVMHQRALAGESVVITNRFAGRVYETAIEPIRDGNGDVTGAFGFAIDVTDRRRAELRLRMQYGVTQVLAEATDISSAIDAVLEVIAEASSGTVGLFWRPIAGGKVIHLTNSWHAPACQSLVEASAKLKFRRGEGLPGRVWASQESLWIADLSREATLPEWTAEEMCGVVSGFALPIAAAGSVCGVLEILSSSHVEIDEELRGGIEDMARQIGLFIARISAQDEMRLSRARLAEAQRIARMGSWEWDLVSDRVAVSDELLHIFFAAPAEFAGTFVAFLGLFGSEDTAIRSVLERALQIHEKFEHLFVVRLPDARLHFLEARGSVIVSDGVVSRVIGTVQDVTEQSLLKEGIERAQRLSSLGRVAASIAHEFNNTLMGISPAAELMVRQVTDPAAVEAARRILKSVQRGKRITGEILRFAQPSEPDLESIDVASWLKTVAGELRQIVGPTIAIEVVPPSTPLFIAGDMQQLNQVIVNLGLNATDAMPSGGEIFLTAVAMKSDDTDLFGLSPTRTYVHLELRDTGSGMDTETAGQIFEPLFTTKRSGTGLGLAVVQQIITQHHGRVSVVSEPGVGTTFHLFLPATVAAERHVSIETAAEMDMLHKRVLLVEDDENVAMGIAELLRMEGFEVEVVGEGKAVMDLITRFHPDVVVLDVGLPDIPGTEILRRIQERYPQLPVVFSTGHADPGLIAKSDSQQRLGFLHKPYSVSTLVGVLAEVMN